MHLPWFSEGIAVRIVSPMNGARAMQIPLGGWQKIGVVLLLILFSGFAGYERYVWSDSAEEIDKEHTAKIDQCNSRFLSEQLMIQNTEEEDEFQKDSEVGQRLDICVGNETLLRKIRIERLKEAIFYTWIGVVFGVVIFGVGWELSGVRD
jgi:hypothetical protein